MLQESVISSVTQVPSLTPLSLPDYLHMLGNNCLEQDSSCQATMVPGVPGENFAT